MVFLVKQNSFDDLIVKIEQFINLDYKDKIMMGKIGRIHVQSNFNRNIIVHEYTDQISRLFKQINS